MSTKKKVAPKAAERKPKYNIGQKGFAITYHKGKPEEVWEVEVVSCVAREYEEKDFLGKKTGIGISYSYMGRTGTSVMNLMECEIFHNFGEAAKEFAKAFLFLLK